MFLVVFCSLRFVRERTLHLGSYVLVPAFSANSSAGATHQLSSENISSVAWEHIIGSRKNALEVGMDQTFNSQQSSSKLDVASAIKFLELNALKSQQSSPKLDVQLLNLQVSLEDHVVCDQQAYMEYGVLGDLNDGVWGKVCEVWQNVKDLWRRVGNTQLKYIDSHAFIAVNMSLTDINASLTEHNLYQQCKLFSRGNSSTQQWEHFFTSSGRIALEVGTILHYQWELLLASKQNSQSSSTSFTYKTLIIPSFLDSNGSFGIQDLCFRQELLEYLSVHDNDASESSKPSWGTMCTSET
nr:hypothetical protein [Tanacetum cinerariifolium]